MKINRLIKPEDQADWKWGVSTNQEDFHIADSLEDAMYEGFERLTCNGAIGEGEEDSIPIWIGPAFQYNAAYFIERVLTEWDNVEERCAEMFYDESMCEYPEDRFTFPTGQKRTEWFGYIRRISKEMCEEFSIDINYYEIESPTEYKVKAWWPKGDTEPHFRCGDCVSD